MSIKAFKEMLNKYDQDCEIAFLKPEHPEFERALEVYEVRERLVESQPKPMVFIQLR